jgi:RHS repeat-associated protein
VSIPLHRDVEAGGIARPRVAVATRAGTWDSAGTGQQLDDGSSQYLYGATGLYAHVKSSQTYYYLTDGLGSVLAEVKSDGTNAVSYQYDAYGNIVNQRGGLYDERQFAGEQADPTGLTYLRARFYDPTTGRLLSRDPLSAGNPAAHHPYSYAADNPALNTDPTGLCGESVYDLCQDNGQNDAYRNSSPFDAPSLSTGGDLGLTSGGQEAVGVPVLKDSPDPFGGLVLGLSAPVLGLSAPVMGLPCDAPDDCLVPSGPYLGPNAPLPTAPTPAPTPPARPAPTPACLPGGVGAGCPTPGPVIRPAPTPAAPVPTPTATPPPYPVPEGRGDPSLKEAVECGISAGTTIGTIIYPPAFIPAIILGGLGGVGVALSCLPIF